MTQSTGKRGNGAFFSREIMGGIPWVIGNRLVLFFVSLATSVVIVRGLGTESFGIYRLCGNVAECALVLCGLGLNTAIMRFVPELSVEKNKAGLLRFLKNSVIAQAFTLPPVGLFLYFLKPYLDDWLFKGDSGLLLLFTMAIVAGRLGRSFVGSVFIALFRVRVVSILGLVYGVSWLGTTALALQLYPSPSSALLAQAGALLVISVVGATLLLKLLRTLDWDGASEGIGRRRVLRIALPRQINQLALLITQRYSEIFFLGYFFAPATVAVYEVGNWLPLVLITFLPNAIQGLFTSGFAEAYSRNPDCLGRLIASYYKALILVVAPIAAFGTFFVTDAVRVLYGEEMIAAGPVASAFFIIHLLSLISIPLSLGIVTKEKLLHTQPLLFLQIFVNLILDWVLISRYGIFGAGAAVVLTFVLTIPVRLYVMTRLLGGIYFPMTFFLKFMALLFGLAYLFSLLVDRANFLTLSGLTVAYVAAYLGLLRVLPLIHRDDVAEIRNMNFAAMNRILDVFVAPPRK